MKDVFNRESIASAESAGDTAFTPAQGISATTVQAAIEEAVQKQTIQIKEENTSAITKGQVLAATGASGEKVQVGLCDCDDPDKIRIMGLLHEGITQNAAGISVYKGRLDNVDTRAANLDINPNGETWLEGDILWVATTPGGMTNVRPTQGRSIKAAITRKGSHETDILTVISHENPVHMRAASGEDIVLGMGDSAGVNKASYRDYANNEVASIDSDGGASFSGGLKTADPVDEHGVGDRGFNDARYLTFDEIIQAVTDTLTVTEVKSKQINNYGQNAENTQTLPAAAKGMSGRVVITTAGAGAFHLKAGAGDKIYLDGTALDDGDKISLSTPAVGNFFTFFTFQNGATAYDWHVISGSGSIVDGGV